MRYNVPRPAPNAITFQSCHNAFIRPLSQKNPFTMRRNTRGAPPSRTSSDSSVPTTTSTSRPSAKRTPSGAWGRLRAPATDPLEVYGLPSKGETRYAIHQYLRPFRPSRTDTAQTKRPQSPRILLQEDRRPIYGLLRHERRQREPEQALQSTTRRRAPRSTRSIKFNNDTTIITSRPNSLTTVVQPITTTTSGHNNTVPKNRARAPDPLDAQTARIPHRNLTNRPLRSTRLHLHRAIDPARARLVLLPADPHAPAAQNPSVKPSAVTRTPRRGPRADPRPRVSTEPPLRRSAAAQSLVGSGARCQGRWSPRRAGRGGLGGVFWAEEGCGWVPQGGHGVCG